RSLNVHTAFSYVARANRLRWSSSHSVATPAKVTASAAFTSCFCAHGSTPSATSRRASSRFSRARFSDTSGYAPSASNRSFPANRYLKRHNRLPLVSIFKYSPRSSYSLYAFSAARAARTRDSNKNGIEPPPRTPTPLRTPILDPHLCYDAVRRPETRLVSFRREK